MTFFTLLPPCVARFNIHKALYEIRIENKGDLPSEKSISRNALLAMISAIFTTAILVQEETILILRQQLFPLLSAFFTLVQLSLLMSLSHEVVDTS